MRSLVGGLVLVAIFFVAFVAVVPASSQSLLVITAAYDGEIAVNGIAQPGTGPITILDISYVVDTPIGNGEVSSQSQFAAVVKLALVEGNQLVAVDNDGQRSQVFTVAPSRQTSAVGDGAE